MRQGEEFWVGGKVAHPICHAARAEIAGLGVASDKKCEFNLRHDAKKNFVPFWGAFRTRRGVTTIGETAWIAEAHRHDGNARRVVKLLAVQIQPGSQAIAGRIVPRNTRLMDFCAGRLANDEKLGRC